MMEINGSGRIVGRCEYTGRPVHKVTTRDIAKVIEMRRAQKRRDAMQAEASKICRQ